MFLAFSSITVNVHSKLVVFRYVHLFCVGTKYLVLLQLFLYTIYILYTSAIFTSNYGIISSYVDSTCYFLGCSVRGRKKNFKTTLASLVTSTEICLCRFCRNYYSFSSAILTLWPIRHFST